MIKKCVTSLKSYKRVHGKSKISTLYALSLRKDHSVFVTL